MNHELVERVLVLFASERPDSPDQEVLTWYLTRDGDISFSVDCSDTFHWASADSDYLTLENIGVLEQTIEDLRATHMNAAVVMYATDLFCARLRKMRPMPPWLDRIKDEEVLKLFLACGPDRTNKEWA